MEGVPIFLISNIADISILSVKSICKKIRKFNVFQHYLNSFVKIGGNKKIIEIDESKFGKRKYNRRHKVEGVWVVGAVERDSRKIILKHVAKRDGSTLLNFCKMFIEKDSHIYSDCWRGYFSLSDYFDSHKTVNHFKTFVNRENNVHTNTIEGNWSGIKRTIPFRCRSNSLSDIYLLRFML